MQLPESAASFLEVLNNRKEISTRGCTCRRNSATASTTACVNPNARNGTGIPGSRKPLPNTTVKCFSSPEQRALHRASTPELSNGRPIAMLSGNGQFSGGSAHPWISPLSFEIARKLAAAATALVHTISRPFRDPDCKATKFCAIRGNSLDAPPSASVIYVERPSMEQALPAPSWEKHLPKRLGVSFRHLSIRGLRCKVGIGHIARTIVA